MCRLAQGLPALESAILVGLVSQAVLGSHAMGARRPFQLRITALPAVRANPLAWIHSCTLMLLRRSQNKQTHLCEPLCHRDRNSLQCDSRKCNMVCGLGPCQTDKPPETNLIIQM